MLQQYDFEAIPLGVRPSKSRIWRGFRLLLILSVSAVFSVALLHGVLFSLADLYLLGGAVALILAMSDWRWLFGYNRNGDRPSEDELRRLFQLVRPYCVPELGGLFLYLPNPRHHLDEQVWLILPVLRDHGLVVGGPWRVEKSRAPPWLGTSHPQLCRNGVADYTVYRLPTRFAEAIF